MFYNRKDNTVNTAHRNDTQNRERIMKASHFTIGKADGDMVCPKPTQPIEAEAKIGDFNVEEAKKNLRMASWTVG